MKRVLIKPKANKTVYDPAAKRNISDLGSMVILDGYWQRLVRDGDVDVIENPAEQLNEKILEESLKSTGDTDLANEKQEEPKTENSEEKSLDDKAKGNNNKRGKNRGK